MSKSDNTMLNDQALSRLVRIGQKETVVSIDVVAENTIDENVIRSVNKTREKVRKSTSLERNNNED
jgi:SNF2 family DNA or RNA helicase